MAAPWLYGAQLRIIGELHGSTTMNVIHFASNTQVNDHPDPLAFLLVQLATAMMRCVVDALLPAVTEDWSFIGCDAKGIYPQPSEPFFVAADAGSKGGQGPTSVSFAAHLVALRTGQAGRRGRGRIFLPPPSEQAMTDSTIEDPTRLQLKEFLDCVLEKFMSAGNDWRLGVLSHKTLTSAGGTFDTAFHEVISLTPRIDVATMVSRKKGRGI